MDDFLSRFKHRQKMIVGQIDVEKLVKKTTDHPLLKCHSEYKTQTQSFQKVDSKLGTLSLSKNRSLMYAGQNYAKRGYSPHENMVLG